MSNDKIELWLLSNGKFLPAERMPLIREKLQILDESKFSILSAVEFKDTTVMLLISIFLGYLGVDRFMLGEIGMGVLKLLTGGLCGILWLIDVIGITKKTKESNFNRLMPYIQ